MLKTKIMAISLDKFRLKKAKISPEEVYCEYNEKRNDNDIETVVEHTIKAKYQPHPDLVNKINEKRLAKLEIKFLYLQPL